MRQYYLYMISAFMLIIGCTSSIESDPNEGWAESTKWVLEQEAKRCERNGHAKNSVDETQCISHGIMREYKSKNYPHMDLIHIFNSRVLSTAHKLEHNEITQEEAKIEYSAAFSAWDQEATRRDYENAQSQAVAEAQKNGRMQSIRNDSQLNRKSFSQDTREDSFVIDN